MSEPFAANSDMTYRRPALPSGGASRDLSWVRPLELLAKLAIGSIGVFAVWNLVLDWRQWQTYQLVADYVAGVPGVTSADLVAADEDSMVFLLIHIALLAVAGGLFITWLWRARHNAENLSPSEHRRAKGWVIGSWICPVVNLWFPLQIVADIWKTSDPAQRGQAWDLAQVRNGALVNWWWATFMLAWIVTRISGTMVRSDSSTLDQFKNSVVIGMLGTALLAAAAVLITMIIRRITRWQSETTSIAPAAA